VTFSGGDFVRVYVNGVLEGEMTDGIISQINGQNSSPFQVGNRGDSLAPSTNGQIDDFGLWDQALTTEQIQKIYYHGATAGDDLQLALGKAVPTTFTVTYNGNGNTGGAVPASQVKFEGLPLTISTNNGNLSQTGFAFNGWNTAADGSGDAIAANAEYTANADLTLYAQWVTAATYTITYNGNDSDSGTVPDAQIKTEDQALTLAANSGNLAKTGFIFAGWNTQADGSGSPYTPGATYAAEGDATLYAMWVTPLYWDGSGGIAEVWTSPENWSTDVGGSVDPATFAGAFDVATFHATSVSSAQTIQTRGNREVLGMEFATGIASTLRSNAAANQNSILTIGSSGITKTGTATVVIGGTNTSRKLDIALSVDQTWQNNVASGDLRIGNNAAQDLLRSFGSGRTLTLSGTNSNNTGSRINSRIQDGSMDGETLFIVKTGPGTWFISAPHNANTYSGGTIVRNGTIIVSPDTNTTLSPTNALGSGEVTLVGSTLSFRATGGTNPTAETINYGNRIVVDGDATIDVRKVGTGSSENKTIGLSTLSIGESILTVTGAHGYDLRFTGAATLVGDATLNVTSARLTIQESIGETGGSRSLTKSGPNTLSLLAANTYSGATTITAGSLTLGASGSISASSSVAIAAGGTLDSSQQESYAIPAGQPVVFGIDGAGSGSSGSIVSAGLDVSNATITYAITGPLDDAVYVLATYTPGELTGTFLSAPAAPFGYELVYDYEGSKIALVQEGVSGFMAWQAANSTVGGLDDDHDNDGVANGVEWFLGGNVDTTGFTPLPGVISTDGNLTVTWTRSAEYAGAYGIDFRVETSETLAGQWITITEGVGPGFVEITGNAVRYTFAAGSRNFARLVVIGP